MSVGGIGLGVSRECHRCHRIGTHAFVPWGSEGWECANDRACRRRAERRLASRVPEARERDTETPADRAEHGAQANK